MEDIGWICNDCGEINKHLELDLEFGKRREKVECSKCRNVMLLDEQERVFKESALTTEIQRNLDFIEGLINDSESNVALKELRGRKRQVEVDAKTLGLFQELDNIRKCIYCGTSNSVENDCCVECGEFDWTAKEVS